MPAPQWPPALNATERQALLLHSYQKTAWGLVALALAAGLFRVLASWAPEQAIKPAEEITSVAWRSPFLQAPEWALRMTPGIGPATSARLMHYRPWIQAGPSWRAVEQLGALSQDQLAALAQRFTLPPDGSPQAGFPTSCLAVSHVPEPQQTALCFSGECIRLVAQRPVSVPAHPKLAPLSKRGRTLAASGKTGGLSAFSGGLVECC